MNEHEIPEGCADYRPGSFYHRRRLRRSRTIKEAVKKGLELVRENERLREWVRQQGMIPPKWVVDPDEADEKGWSQAG